MSKENQGWIGFDLDGTLAEYHGFVSPDHIGEPIPGILLLARAMLASGREIRIMTARANPDMFSEQHEQSIAAIEAWCEAHLGCKVPITCKKDQAMVAFYDDRAIQVLPNQGVSLVGEIFKLRQDIINEAKDKSEAVALVSSLLRRITN